MKQTAHRCPYCHAFAVVYASDATVFHICPKLADRAPSRRLATFTVEERDRQEA